MGCRWKRSLFIFHVLSFWNGYFGNVNIFMSVLCIWMMNEYILRKIAAVTERDRGGRGRGWEKGTLSCINLVQSLKRDSQPKSEQEKTNWRISYAFIFYIEFYYISFFLVLLVLIFLVSSSGGGRHLKKKEREKRCTQLYVWLSTNWCETFFLFSIWFRWITKNLIKRRERNVVEVWCLKWKLSVICQYENITYIVLQHTHSIKISIFST